MNKTKSTKGSANRTRNWTFIMYPESAPADWKTLLNELHTQVVISPLHDKDINADETPKKAHWHVLLMFEGNKSYKQIEELIAPFNGTIAKPVNSVKALIRYFTHIDNPEKHQYEQTDIITLGGAEVTDAFKPTQSAKYIYIREMAQFIAENDITEYEDIFYYAMNYRFDDWFEVLCDSGTYVISNLIKSRRGRYLDAKKAESV